MLREDIGDVSLYKRDPNYLCLYTNCDTDTFYGNDYLASQVYHCGGFAPRWIMSHDWSQMRKHVQRTFAGMTALIRTPRRRRDCIPCSFFLVATSGRL